MTYDLHCPVPDVVHLPHPQHWMLRFEMLGYTLPLGHLLCQQEHLLRRLLVDVGEVGVQPAAGQKLSVQGFSLLLDVPQMSLTPYPYGTLIFIRSRQAREIIVPV